MEKMMMPAYYNVLSTEEMTYTEGGANATMSEALLCWLIPPYGWFKGVTAVRDYRRKNPNTWMEKGLDALATDMEKSTANTIRDLAKEGFTMVVVTHEIPFSREVADWVVFMADGRVVEEGKPRDVLVNPQQPRTREFLKRYI